jgi:hypothetical protein
MIVGTPNSIDNIDGLNQVLSQLINDNESHRLRFQVSQSSEFESKNYKRSK